MIQGSGASYKLKGAGLPKGSVTTQLQVTLAMGECGWPSVLHLPVLQKKQKSGF